VQNYIDDIKSKLNLQEKVILQDAFDESFWKLHQPIIDIAQSVYIYIDSQTFKNVLEKLSKSRGVTLTVELVATKFMREAYIKYNRLRAEYRDWMTLDCTRISTFWKGVKDIDYELELMSRGMKWYPKDDLKKAIIECWVANVRNKLKEPLTLIELYKAINEINRSLTDFDANCWKIIKSLSFAGDFLTWLYTVGEVDLRNLMNTVDESEDREVQENTITSLIEVKQFLMPLMNSIRQFYKEGKSTHTIIFKFLDHIRDIASKNPSLSQKISQCCLSNLAIQHVYFTILNRGEAIKMRIRDAATIGEYKFFHDENHDKCVVELSYEKPYEDTGRTKTTIHDLSSLQDLQGQALLIAKQASFAYVICISTENENNLEQGAIELMNFVQQVDTVHQIIKYASQLMELGHFSYREWELKVHATEDMELHLKKLDNDLQDWENNMKRAQERHYYLTFYTARHILAFYDYFSCRDEVDPKNRETCKTLLRIVSKNAILPPNEGDIKVDYITANFYEVLCEIGIKLHNIFAQAQKTPRKINANIELNVSDIVRPGNLFVAACNKSYQVPNIILSLYANHGTYPEPWQLLMCRTSTTADELSLFIKRCFNATNHGYGKRLFCISGLEFLEIELQYKLANDIRNLKESDINYHLALICCQESGISNHILDQFSEYVCNTNGLNTNSMKNMYKELCPNVFCISSDSSGQGKTEYIKSTSLKSKFIAKSVLISDNINFDGLVSKLNEYKLRSLDCLHLNIVSINNSSDINVFLFELLTLGMVTNKVDIICLPKQHVYIELASTTTQNLFNSIPIVQYLKNMHLKWDINNLNVSKEISSQIQIVSHYLDVYDRKELNEKDIILMGNNAIKKPLSPGRCRELIQKYFLDDNEANLSSYRFIEIFLNVFADQLSRMSLSLFFSVENLKLMVKDKDIRTTLVKTLLEVSKEFATRSIATRSAQIKSTHFIRDQLETIVQWDTSNHLVVFFLSQTPDSICALYRDRTKVPGDVKRLLVSQETSHYEGMDPFSRANPQAWELENYNTMSSEALLERLERIARESMNEIELPKYALSSNNIVKMALILLRARANIPVVICGEAGCGKTSLISFLAKIVKAKFEVLPLHAGVLEDQIIDFMGKGAQHAKNDPTWLFFDEINTCNHIGLLADLIAHRTLLGKPIHHNIRLFAACNPYRLRKKNLTNVGLEKQYHEHSRLVYQVHPLPDQILDYVWDYGVLKPEEERMYIKMMIEDRLGSYPVFLDLLCASQHFIRTVEESYTVSLRDVKRAIKLVLWFHKSLKGRPPATRPRGVSFLTIKQKNYPPTDPKKLRCYCFILSLGLCYQSRLYDKDLRKKYQESMAQIFKKRNENITATDFEQIIRKEQEDIMQRMLRPPSTADNDALLENVLAMIVCILNKIPVFIIGSPGSSKSLAVRLISSNLRGADSDDEYFRTLPQVFFVPHQGSASSTSDGILKVFKKAENVQENHSEGFSVQAVVLLDEVGLAETSPFNPLKVLHSLLEPSYPKDTPTVSVVGISNWRLDNSKSSRALLVQRPKFSLDDLTSTASMLLGEKTKSGISDFKLKQLAEAYLNYEQNQDVKNFHGLRDYYALVKCLSNNEVTIGIFTGGGIPISVDGPVRKAFNFGYTLVTLLDL
ncbi:1322_t:CDS:2, partial [Dentiscutata erythropus]